MTEEKKKRSRSQAKADRARRDATSTGRPRLAIVDAEIMVYQAVTEALVEESNSDDEWFFSVDLKMVKAALMLRFKEVCQAVRANRMVVALGSKDNWRKKVMPEYKAHRKDKRKPLGYRACVEWLEKSYECKSVPGWEADDVAGVLLTAEDYEAGYEKVAVSEDKDFQGVPGLLFNPRKPEDGIRLVTREQADHFHLVQALTGDSSDGYKGCPGIGAVKAELVLMQDGLKATHAQKWANLVRAFKAQGLGEREALENARVARILRAEDLDEDGNMRLWTPPTDGPARGAGKKKGAARGKKA